jgi:hypothetical protein
VPEPNPIVMIHNNPAGLLNKRKRDKKGYPD